MQSTVIFLKNFITWHGKTSKAEIMYTVLLFQIHLRRQSEYI
jgi:hypothetical protein